MLGVLRVCRRTDHVNKCSVLADFEVVDVIRRANTNFSDKWKSLFRGGDEEKLSDASMGSGRRT